MHSRLARIGLASAAVIALAPALLRAQTPPAVPVTAAARAATPAPSRVPAPVATPTASQTAAALELFKAIKLRESIDGTTVAMVDSEISHNPTLTPYRDVMLRWLRKYMTWDAMLPELTRLYAETYTEGEMKAMAMFYSSPVGQKALTKTPELLQKTAAIGAKVSQPHSPELNELLTAKRDELKAKAAAKTPGAVSPPPASAIPAGTPPPARPTPAPKDP
jgi:hypothetical protein